MTKPDPNFDPVTASKDARKASKLKNAQQQLKNQQRAAANEASANPTKELNAQQKVAAETRAHRESRKGIIERELKITKTSTASMGKFDKKLEGEGKEKNVKRKVSLFPHYFLTSSRLVERSSA